MFFLFFFVGRSTKKRKLRAAFPFSPCSLTEHHINDVVLRCNRVPLWASAVSLPNTVALEWVESVFFFVVALSLSLFFSLGFYCALKRSGFMLLSHFSFGASRTTLRSSSLFFFLIHNN